MPAFFELKDWRDIYAKAQHDYAGLHKLVNAYDAFNFFCTVNHLRDWFENDERIEKSILNDCKNTIYSQPIIETIRELCNHAKHHTLTNREVPESSANRGFGYGRFGVGIYGVGEPSYRVMVGEESVSVLELGEKALAIWSDFFVKHDLLTDDKAKTYNLTANG